MSPLLQRVLVLWAACLALLVCFCFQPVSRLTGLLLLAVAWGAIAMVWYLVRPCPWPGIDGHLDNLPVSNSRQPVVLVCGDRAQYGAADGPVQTVPAGTWVQVEKHQDLSLAVRTVLQRRPDWGNQMAVMISVCPQQHYDPGLLAQSLREWRRQIGQLRQETGYALPLILSGQIGSAIVRAPLWFTDSLRDGRRVWYPSGGGATMSAWVSAGETMTASSMVLMDNLLRWLHQHVVLVLTEPEPDSPPLSPNLLLSGLAPRLDNALPASLWSDWLRNRTSLHTVAGWQPLSGETSACSHAPRPDFVLSLLPDGQGLTPRLRAGRYGLWLLLLAALIALGSSAWRNNERVPHLRVVTQHFGQVPMPHARQEIGAMASASG